MVVDFYPRERIEAIWEACGFDFKELNKELMREFGYSETQAYVASNFLFEREEK